MNSTYMEIRRGRTVQLVSLESFFCGHYVGAYIWLASTTLLAVVLFRYGRASKVTVAS